MQRKLKYNSFQNQYINTKRVLQNRTVEANGLEYFFRVILILISWFSIGLFFKFILDLIFNRSIKARRLFVDLYVIAKLVIPILIIINIFDCNQDRGCHTYDKIALYFSIYSMLETITSLISLIFLSDLHMAPRRYNRSLLLLFLNFIEIVFEYAVIFSFYARTTQNFFNVTKYDNTDIIYFSFVSMSTLGYGDIYVQDSFGKKIVICQILTSFIFVGLFLSYYVSKIQDSKHFDSSNK